MCKPLPRWPIGSAILCALVIAAVARGQDRSADSGRATVVVKVPGGAVLSVDGQPTRQTGAVRTFSSPPLTPGKDFSYTFTAVIEPNNYTTITRTRKVTVRAGRTTEADMMSNDEKQPDNIVIRYVPTPEPVVNAMLDLAKVGKDDVVYDLGCGDGRIVTTAVSKYGARRGVGFDIDPERIADSRANAKAARVEDKVQFRQENVLKIKDFSPASVVTLYMSDNLNEAVRPDLRKTLKPGSRVVSHRFLMGDWKPDKTITVTHDGEEYLIHLWNIGKKP
jgi:uncharacterized protein (TIGR03000 family)